MIFVVLYAQNHPWRGSAPEMFRGTAPPRNHLSFCYKYFGALPLPEQLLFLPGFYIVTKFGVTNVSVARHERRATEPTRHRFPIFFLPFPIYTVDIYALIFLVHTCFSNISLLRFRLYIRADATYIYIMPAGHAVARPAGSFCV
ncbi:MAG: hypothetical protein EPGJADBJ_04667 [Saprospiraceae bacterium]|nr:hypothetical protein [Saprospiraceae bacterium]